MTHWLQSCSTHQKTFQCYRERRQKSQWTEIKQIPITTPHRQHPPTTTHTPPPPLLPPPLAHTAHTQTILNSIAPAYCTAIIPLTSSPTHPKLTLSQTSQNWPNHTHWLITPHRLHYSLVLAHCSPAAMHQATQATNNLDLLKNTRQNLICPKKKL